MGLIHATIELIDGEDLIDARRHKIGEDEIPAHRGVCPRGQQRVDASDKRRNQRPSGSYRGGT
jgi:hypothetical protein